MLMEQGYTVLSSEEEKSCIVFKENVGETPYRNNKMMGGVSKNELYYDKRRSKGEDKGYSKKNSKADMLTST